jgi:hypothetical protein
MAMFVTCGIDATLIRLLSTPFITNGSMDQIKNSHQVEKSNWVQINKYEDPSAA